MRASPTNVLRRLSILASGALVALVATLPLGMSGCSNQGEGERCTLFGGADASENGTDECSAGLVCQAAGGAFTNPVGTTQGAGTLGICCPPAGTAATAAACIPMTSGSTMAGPPVGDGGLDADSGTDAKPDVHVEHDGSLDGHDDASGAHDARTDAHDAPSRTDAHDATIQG